MDVRTAEPDPAPTRSAARFPARVYRHGTEPDARFTLANERTFLAWIRTSLALIAGGVALEAMALPLQPGLRLAASLILMTVGAALPLLAWWEWGAVERALRRGEPLPSSRLALPLAGSVVVVGVLLVAAVVVH